MGRAIDELNNYAYNQVKDLKQFSSNIGTEVMDVIDFTVDGAKDAANWVGEGAKNIIEDRKYWNNYWTNYTKPRNENMTKQRREKLKNGLEDLGEGIKRELKITGTPATLNETGIKTGQNMIDAINAAQQEVNTSIPTSTVQSTLKMSQDDAKNFNGNAESIRSGYGQQQYNYYKNEYGLTSDESSYLANQDVNKKINEYQSYLESTKGKVDVSNMTIDQIMSTPYEKLPESVQKNYGNMVSNYKSGYGQQKYQEYVNKGLPSEQSSSLAQHAVDNKFNS